MLLESGRRFSTSFFHFVRYRLFTKAEFRFLFWSLYKCICITPLVGHVSLATSFTTYILLITKTGFLCYSSPAGNRIDLGRPQRKEAAKGSVGSDINIRSRPRAGDPEQETHDAGHLPISPHAPPPPRTSIAREPLHSPRAHRKPERDRIGSLHAVLKYASSTTNRRHNPIPTNHNYRLSLQCLERHNDPLSPQSNTPSCWWLVLRARRRR
ncbi:hypothetical protein BJ170DRAFT_180189 [Xylariales sp. AK1849]|nr:hypothetical protein BJ170DRAFT_180189 [Xylariales sp. AK1849]